MPYSLFMQLGLGEPRPTCMSLQLADQSIKYPRGIIEDILVKVEDFIFPVDFVILDMAEDREVPLILVRPFLATARVVINVGNDNLTLKIEEDQLTVKPFASLKQSLDFDDSCFSIDVIDESVFKFKQDNLSRDAL